MTKKKVATKPQAKKVAPKKAVVKKVIKKAEPKIIVELESYEMKMVIPTGAYANIQPRIVVKTNSVEDAHKFIAPHMNKLWKEYFMVNERRPAPAPAPAPVAPKKPVVDHELSHVSGPVTTRIATTTPNPVAMPAGVSATTDGKLEIESTPKADFNYLKDPLEAKKADDTRPLSVDEIAEKVGGKVLPNFDSSSPASSVAFTKASQAIDSCMSLDALELIRAQVDKSVKLTPEDKEAIQPLLIARLETLSNGI